MDQFHLPRRALHTGHEKVGLRLYLRTERSEKESRETQVQIVKKIRASICTVENFILGAAPGLLSNGNVTVMNPHQSLRRAYEYFREQAENPILVADQRTTFEPADAALSQKVLSFKSGKIQMELNAFHDMVTAVTAYLSRLERDLVLVLAFSDFDPTEDDLTDMIGSRCCGARSSTASSAMKATHPGTATGSLKLLSAGVTPTRMEASRKETAQ